ncbi:MAG: alpha/beta fold hydrolase [Acidobacteriota bacterium]
MTSQRPKSPWLAYHKPQPAARLRLFCLHYAGGAASVYRGWQALVPPEVEICPVQLPGRESRLRDEPITRVPALVEALETHLTPWLDRPFAFFGHSMGAILSYELVLRMASKGGPTPRALLVSGRRAPHRLDDEEVIYDLPDDEFKQELRELNGTPEAVLEHPELMELLLPVLRADFAVCDTYEPSLNAQVPCPIFAYCGLGDEKVSSEDMRAWDRYTASGFKIRLFDGDHFFLQGAAFQDLVAAVSRDLAVYLEPAS